MAKKGKKKSSGSASADENTTEVEYTPGDKEKLSRWNKARLHWERRPGKDKWENEKDLYVKTDPESPKRDWWLPNAYSFCKKWQSDTNSNHVIAKFYYKYGWDWSKIRSFASDLRNGHLGFDRMPGLIHRYMPQDLLEAKRTQLEALGCFGADRDHNPDDSEEDA